MNSDSDFEGHIDNFQQIKYTVTDYYNNLETKSKNQYHLLV